MLVPLYQVRLWPEVATPWKLFWKSSIVLIGFAFNTHQNYYIPFSESICAAFKVFGIRVVLNEGQIPNAVYFFACGSRYVVLKTVLWPCGPMDKASDYESGDSRFESWQGRNFFSPQFGVRSSWCQNKVNPDSNLYKPGFKNRNHVLSSHSNQFVICSSESSYLSNCKSNFNEHFGMGVLL